MLGTIESHQKDSFPFIPNSAYNISFGIAFEGPLFHDDVIFIFSNGVLHKPRRVYQTILAFMEGWNVRAATTPRKDKGASLSLLTKDAIRSHNSPIYNECQPQSA